MILLTALLAGGLAGLLLARLGKQPWTFPHVQASWLAIVAFLPQGLAFYLPVSRTLLPDPWAAACLVLSDILFIVFCWLNRRLAGFWLLAGGAALNLLVIACNGGFMPISPQTAAHLISPALLETLAIGERFGLGKDILLLPEQTRLAWLSDRFLLPAWSPNQVAFSLGDLFIALGAFWLMAVRGQPPRLGRQLPKKRESCYQK